MKHFEVILDKNISMFVALECGMRLVVNLNKNKLLSCTFTNLLTILTD